MTDVRKQLWHGTAKQVPSSVAGQRIIIRDEKANGTDGGTFTLGAWRTRDLNTIVVDETGDVVLSANQFTLRPGTYVMSASVPAFRVDRHKAKLRNVDAPADVLIGSNAHCSQVQVVFSHSFIRGQFSIAVPTTFEIQHQCQLTQAADGFGLDSSFGVIEVYTTVELTKVT